MLKVSPFWGLLVSSWMPEACGARMYCRRAGGCPELPLAIWEVVFGPGGPPWYLMPDRKWLLPYLVSDPTRRRQGLTRDRLHRIAVELGVAEVKPEMRKLLVGWRDSWKAIQEAMEGDFQGVTKVGGV